jgi:hypothetical protein
MDLHATVAKIQADFQAHVMSGLLTLPVARTLMDAAINKAVSAAAGGAGGAGPSVPRCVCVAFSRNAT